MRGDDRVGEKLRVLICDSDLKQLLRLSSSTIAELARFATRVSSVPQFAAARSAITPAAGLNPKP